MAGCAYNPTSFSVFSRVPNENERRIERCFSPCLGFAARPAAAAEVAESRSEGEQRGLILCDTVRWLSPRAAACVEAEGNPARRRGLARRLAMAG